MPAARFASPSPARARRRRRARARQSSSAIAPPRARGPTAAARVDRLFLRREGQAARPPRARRPVRAGVCPLLPPRSAKFGGKRLSEGKPRPVKFGIYWLGDRRKRKAPLAQRARRKRHDRPAQRRKRAGRSPGRGAQRRDLARGHLGEQRRHQIGLARKIAIDRAGGDPRSWQRPARSAPLPCRLRSQTDAPLR